MTPVADDIRGEEVFAFVVPKRPVAAGEEKDRALALLFVVCVALHSRLYDLRPEASQLTRFYLVMSAGGVLGGLTTAQAVGLRRRGLRAFVISGNLGFDDGVARYERPGVEIAEGVRGFIDAVRAG